MADLEGMIHLVGPDVTIDGHARQRCSWCGALLIDQDLRLVAVAVGEGEEPGPFPFWPIGSLLRHDGAVRSLVEHTDHPDGKGGNVIPPGSCLALDPELTGGPVG